MNRILSILLFLIFASQSPTSADNFNRLNSASILSKKISTSSNLRTSIPASGLELLEKFVEEQVNRIEDLSTAISTSQGLDDLAVLGLHNKRGIAYFFMGKFDKALEDFNHILVGLQLRQTFVEELVGTALFGRLFCHAFKNQLQETSGKQLSPKGESLMVSEELPPAYGLQRTLCYR